MRTVLLIGIICCCTTLGAVERGTPAKLIFRDGRTLGPVYLLEWTFEKARYLLDQGKTASGDADTATILDIELTHSDRAFPGADFQMDAKNYADAIGGFTTAMRTSLAAPTRMMAQFNIAICYGELKKYDRAIQELDAFIQAYPKWVYLVDAYARRASYLLKKGDAAGAETAYRELDKLAPGFGPTFGMKAKAKSAVGLASILRAKGEDAEAAKLTLAAMKTVSPAENPEEWAKMAWDLVTDYQKAGTPELALPIYEKLRFAPVGNWFRAAAFLGLAKSNQTANRLVAFDQACVAIVLTDDQKLSSEARAVAEAVVTAIRADAEVSNAEKEEYIAYLKKL